MSVSCLYNKQGCVPFKNSVSVALEKSLFLIYVIQCCDDGIVNSNVNKPNVASKRSHAISVQKLFGKDNSVLNKVIRVPHIIGSRTALIGNDMSLGGLYDTTIPISMDIPCRRL